MFKKPRNVRRAAPSLNKLEIVYGSFSQAVPSSGNFSSNECFQAASFTFRPEELETGLPARFSLGDFRTTLLAGHFYRPNITGERGIRLYAVKYDDDDDDDDDTAPKLQRIVNNDAFYELLRGFCDSYEPGSTLNLLAEETEFRSQDRPPSASPLKSVVSDSHSTLRVGVPVSDAAAVRGILHNALLPSGAKSVHREPSSASSSSGGQEKTAEDVKLAGKKKPRLDIKNTKQKLEFMLLKASKTVTVDGKLNAEVGLFSRDIWTPIKTWKDYAACCGEDLNAALKCRVRCLLCDFSECGPGEFQHLNKSNRVYTLGGDHKMSCFALHNKSVHAKRSGKTTSEQQKESNKGSFVNFLTGAAALVQSANARYKRETPQSEGGNEGGEGVLVGAASGPSDLGILHLQSTPYNKIVMPLQSFFAEVELTTDMTLSDVLEHGPRCVSLLNVDVSEAIVQGLSFFESSGTDAPRVVVIPGQLMDAWLKNNTNSSSGSIANMDEDLFDKEFLSRGVSESICLKGLSPLPAMDIALSTVSYVQDTELFYALVVITQSVVFLLSPRGGGETDGPLMSEITQGTSRIFKKLGLGVSAVENVKCPLLGVAHDNSPGVAHLARIVVENTHSLGTSIGIHDVFNEAMNGGHKIYANHRDGFNNWVDEEISIFDTKKRSPSVRKVNKQKMAPVISWVLCHDPNDDDDVVVVALPRAAATTVAAAPAPSSSSSSSSSASPREDVAAARQATGPAAAPPLPQSHTAAAAAASVPALVVQPSHPDSSKGNTRRRQQQQQLQPKRGGW